MHYAGPRDQFAEVLRHLVALLNSTGWMCSCILTAGAA